MSETTLPGALSGSLPYSSGAENRAQIGALAGQVKKKPVRRYSAIPMTLWKYIAREFMFCFFVAFLFFFAIFFVNQLLLMAEDILAKQAPFAQVFMLLVFATPSIFAISFPFASLVGALMAVGRLSSDNELLACMAAGIRTRTVFRPFVLLAILISIFSFIMNDVFLPLGTLEFGKLYRKVIAMTPAVELGPWAVKRFGNAIIVTGKPRGKTIGDILVFDTSEDGSRRIISASTANLDIGEAGFDAVLSLDNVWQQSLKPGKTDSFEWDHAKSMSYRIKLREKGEAHVQIGPREMASRDLAKVIGGKESLLAEKAEIRNLGLASSREKLSEIYDSGVSARVPWKTGRDMLAQTENIVLSLLEPITMDRTLQVYKLEYAKKFSIPAGALFFVFLAFPLGMGARKSGRSVGFGLGILVSVLYWAMLLAGQTLGTRFSFDPSLAMWLPNIIAVVAGIFFWLIRKRRA